MFLLWLRQLPWCGDRTPASVPSPAEGRSSPTNTPIFFPLLPSSHSVLRGSIFSFPLVRASCPLSGALPYGFCIWRCIPDVSMERDVLHIHLFLRHLVLASVPFLREERLLSERFFRACTFVRAFWKSQAWIPGSVTVALLEIAHADHESFLSLNYTKSW